MITVLNTKTKELIGFDESTSSSEINQAMRGYNYGEISTHKESMYEKVFQPALKALGADIAHPRFVFSRPEPEPLRAFTTSAVRDASFGIIQDRGAMEQFDKAEQDKYPVASFLGSLTGQTGAIVASSGIGALIKLPALGAWVASKVGTAVTKLAPTLNSAKVTAKAGELAGRVVGGAVNQGGVGAIYGGIRESVAQINEEHPEWGRVGEAVLKDSGAFAIYGGVGAGILSKPIGTATIAGIGYGMAKADGASEEDALLNGAVMGVFHAISANDSPEARKRIVNGVEDLVWGYLKAKSPIMAKSVAGKAANEFKMMVAQEVINEKKVNPSEIQSSVSIGEPQRVSPIEQIVASRENTEAFVNKVAEKMLVKEELNIDEASAKIQKELDQNSVDKAIWEAENAGQLTRSQNEGIRESASRRISTQGGADVVGEAKVAELTKAPVVESPKEVKTSKAFERAKEKYSEELGQHDSAEYTPIQIADQMARAFEFLDKDISTSKKIAHGIENAPDGVLETAVSIAYAEKMLADGNIAEFAKAVKSRSLRQTARGQEIVLEKASATNVNDPVTFIKQVLQARMNNAGKNLFDAKLSIKEKSQKGKAMDRIKTEAKRLKKEVVDKKQIDIEEAQKIIDGLLCKR